MPDLDTADERLYTIPGSPPNLLNEKPGDAFAPRNQFALEIDDKADPPMFQGDRYTLCGYLAVRSAGTEGRDAA